MENLVTLERLKQNQRKDYLKVCRYNYVCLMTFQHFCIACFFFNYFKINFKLSQINCYNFPGQMHLEIAGIDTFSFVHQLNILPTIFGLCFHKSMLLL
jgi:hypothetical protein